MRIQHNIMAMSSYRNYTNNVSAMKGNLEKLSSGYKINRAGDDAAGLAISEKMRAQITGLKQAQNNAKSAINLVQTAEGALQEVQDMLNRMVKLAEQSANGTYEDGVDRKQLQKEFTRLTEEIDRINQSANFNGKALFSGTGATTPDPEDPTETGLTAADITAPTGAAPAFTDQSGSNPAEVTLDFTGIAFAKSGEVTVSYAGKDYNITVTEDTDADAFAAAFVTAYAGDKIDDTGAAGAFTATDNGDGTVTLTATSTSNQVTSSLATELAKKPTFAPKATAETAETEGGEEAAAPKKYESTITAPDGKKLGANDTIKIGGKTYTMKSGDDTGDNIDIGTGKAETFAAQIAEAVKRYNQEAGEDFTAAYDGTTGKITFTAKDGKNPTAAPAFVIGDATNSGDDQIKAGTVTEVPAEDDGGDDDNTTTGGETAFNFQVGDTNDGYNKITVKIKSIASTAIKDISQGTGKTLSELKVDTEDNAGAALKALKGMVDYVSDIRGDLGAAQNRLTHTINNLSVMEENIQDAESTIRDTDVADEMMAYTKNNILIQSAQAMLAQANQVPQGVLQLLQ